MTKKLTAITVTALLALGIAGCGGNRDVIDGKARIPVPVPSASPVTCYLLEVDRESAQGGEQGEDYHCVSEREWDKNRVGEDWVDANGKRK